LIRKIQIRSGELRVNIELKDGTIIKSVFVYQYIGSKSSLIYKPIDFKKMITDNKDIRFNNDNIRGVVSSSFITKYTYMNVIIPKDEFKFEICVDGKHWKNLYSAKKISNSKYNITWCDEDHFKQNFLIWIQRFKKYWIQRSVRMPKIC